MFVQSLVLAAALFVPQTTPPAKEAEYLCARADVHLMRREFDAAADLYRQALAASADYPAAHRGLGRVLDLQRRHAEAKAEYRAALRLANEFERPELFHLLAISFVFVRDFDEARRAQQQWLDLVLARNKGLLPNGYFDFYDLAIARGDMDEAERVLTAYYSAELGAAPTDAADPLAPLKDVARARFEAQRAIVAARRGRADEARSLLAHAERGFRDAINAMAAKAGASRMPTSQVSPEPADEIMFPAGEAAFWLGDAARAIRLMSAMTLKQPRHNWMLGQSYEREGNVQAAREAYQRIVDTCVLSIELAWLRPLADERLRALRP